MGSRSCGACMGGGSRLISRMVPNYGGPGGSVMREVQERETCTYCSGTGIIYFRDPPPPPPPVRKPVRKPTDPKGRASGAADTGGTEEGHGAARSSQKKWGAEEYLGAAAAIGVVWMAARGGWDPQWYWWPGVFMGVLIGATLFLRRFQGLTKLLCIVVVLSILAVIGMMVAGKLP